MLTRTEVFSCECEFTMTMCVMLAQIFNLYVFKAMIIFPLFIP